MEKVGVRIQVIGIVQGVGFRPFVYGLASHLGLCGWVRNTSAGVEIEVDGSPKALQMFIEGLKNEAPPLARIDSIEVEDRPINGYTTFEILHSETIADAFQPVSPDVCICPDCLRELFDPQNRRYRYPFINCTNCGPRFTIIKDVPYDRPNTTMAPFEMCPDCAAEYHNPLDRRFHAQPIACSKCGPQVWLEFTSADPNLPQQGEEQSGDLAILETQRLLLDGKIVAIKGLGGFHLACDALNPEAVKKLRNRKRRVDKPFALMMLDLNTVEQHCYLNDTERTLLTSRQRPILILRRRPESPIAHQVAPGQDTLGVMLPYTPLHYLLFVPHPLSPALQPPTALVMTSGNLSEEPIAYENSEARQQLSSLADAFLMHNRPIHTRCDDSVYRVIDQPKILKNQDGHPRPLSHAYPLRRARGYAPDPILLPWDAPPILATGAELKNTFCLARNQYAFISHHIGDLENYETLRAFEDGIAHFEHLFRLKPQAVAYDLHPNYLATRYALQRAERDGLPAIGVQHHHAHIASCMAEHCLPDDEPVIGLSFDGTGYGEDGAIWGGEIILAHYSGYQRLAHLKYVPLAGGDKATRQPWRIALAWLSQAGITLNNDLPPMNFIYKDGQYNEHALDVILAQIKKGFNAPLTSSMGRLFDAVSSLVGLRHVVNYEAQAAIELEAIADPLEKGAYKFEIYSGENHLWIIDPTPVIEAIVRDLRHKVEPATISARFHNGIVDTVDRLILILVEQWNAPRIVLSGGVWQNMILLHKTLAMIQRNGIEVFYHHRVPTNDGGLSLGQVAVAIHRLKAVA